LHQPDSNILLSVSSYLVTVTREEIVESVSVVGDAFRNFGLAHQGQQVPTRLIVEGFFGSFVVLKKKE
jgi:hypothetical protein